MARELAIENGKLKSNLDANGNKVANLAPPTSDGDAATKKYVDERPVPPSSWSDITGKPTTFPPEAHTHTKSEITDFPTSMPPTAHSHANDGWFTTAIEDVKLWAKSLLPEWLTRDYAEPATVESVANKADRASIAPEYSVTSAYSVGAIVYYGGNIYQCKTAIAGGGEAWNAEHWELRKLDDFFTESNSLLTSRVNNLIDAKVGDVNAVLAAALDGSEVA